MKLPIELIRLVARVSHPNTALTMRNQSRLTREIILVSDVIWAEAGWRSFTMGTSGVWWWAAEKGHADIAILYIADIPVEDAMRSVRLLAKRGHNAAVRSVLETHRVPTTLLRWAARENLPDLATMILDTTIFGRDRRAVSDASAALLEACSEGYCDVVDVILDGAREGKVHIAEDEFYLYRACQNGHVGVVELLLESGSLAEDEEQLLSVAARGGHATVVKLLLARGFRQGMETALTQAIDGGNVDAVCVLKDAGTVVESSHITCAACDPDVLRLLLPFDNPAVLSQSLLFVAEAGCGDSVKLLYDAGGKDTRIVDRALCNAVSRGHRSVARVLVDRHAGCDVSSALAIATVLGHKLIQSDLEKVGAIACPMTPELQHKIMYYYQVRIP